MGSPAESFSAQGPSSSEPSVEPRTRPHPKASLTLGLAAVGLVTVVLSSQSILIAHIPRTAQLGLLELLPWSYWIGLSMIGLAVFAALRGGRWGLFAATGTLFFAVFGGTPLLFEPNPPVWDAYVHLAGAQSIGLRGELPKEIVSYPANWPGFFLLASSASSVGGLDPLEMLSLLPFLTGGLTFLALFVLLRSLFDPSTAAIGSVLGSLLNVWGQFHFSPQSVGLLLALLVLAVVWRTKTSFRVASTLLFLGLVVSHPTSTILVLGILIAHVVLLHLLSLRRPTETSPREPEPRFAHSPALPFGATWVAWLFFLAIGSAQTAQTAILTQMNRILQIPEQTLNVATATSVESIFVWAPLIRLASLVIFGLIGLTGLIVLSRRPGSRGLAHFLWAALGSLIVFTLGDILLLGGALFDRAFLFFALLTPAIGVAAISGSRLRRSVRGGILALFLVISLAAASTTYYQQAFYLVSDGSAAVSEHLERVERGASVLDGLYPRPVWLDPASQQRYAMIGFFAIYPTPFGELSGDAVHAVFDGTAELWYAQWRGIEVFRFYEEDASGYSLIYANGKATIHLIRQPG